MKLYSFFLKPLLFLFTPEKAHSLTVFSWRMVLKIPFLNTLLKNYFSFSPPSLQKKVFGISFKNPVGLAAGFDKDGKYFDDMAALGFGFIEIGTVTPKSQPGNEKPRLFRLPNDEALINRMGFNNDGVDAMVRRLKNQKNKNIIIGGNIGKNKNTPNENALDDYRICLEKLYDVVDYFVVNVSSPNTPGLRELQEKEPLSQLLKALVSDIQKKENHKPLLLKIAPDLTDSQLDDIIEIVLESGTSGIIATNTTISRAHLSTPTDQIGAGGLSGKPLSERSTQVVRYIVQKSNGNIPVIGVGGIANGRDAEEKLAAGASLVQVYTGLIYEGPSLVRNINKYLSKSFSK